ncbi:hypothetical protein ACGFKX_17890 [Pseudonocardia alni]|uniref:hypothetical protein n=1 Tax=Pseudonocardia alni TaxID=33907 RepID=UPI0012FDD4D8
MGTDAVGGTGGTGGIAEVAGDGRDGAGAPGGVDRVGRADEPVTGAVLVTADGPTGVVADTAPRAAFLPFAPFAGP